MRRGGDGAVMGARGQSLSLLSRTLRSPHPARTLGLHARGTSLTVSRGDRGPPRGERQLRAGTLTNNALALCRRILRVRWGPRGWQQAPLAIRRARYIGLAERPASASKRRPVNRKGSPVGGRRRGQLGQFPDAPASLLVSAAADVFPLNHPELSDLIDGSIGEGSPFHELFGYYAQGVDERTATLPSGWRERLVKISNPNTRGITGLCLEVHDLAISKYVAGREKDREFTRELAREGMVRHDTLVARERETKLSPQMRKVVRSRIAGDF
jgi:hypothetical protein